jgi:hypothetical protein
MVTNDHAEQEIESASRMSPDSSDWMDLTPEHNMTRGQADQDCSSRRSTVG